MHFSLRIWHLFIVSTLLATTISYHTVVCSQPNRFKREIMTNNSSGSIPRSIEESQKHSTPKMPLNSTIAVTASATYKITLNAKEVVTIDADSSSGYSSTLNRIHGGSGAKKTFNSTVKPQTQAEKQSKLIADGLTNAQQLSLPNTPDVWSLVSMRSVPKYLAAVNATQRPNSTKLILAEVANNTEAINKNENVTRKPLLLPNYSEETLLNWQRVANLDMLERAALRSNDTNLIRAVELGSKDHGKPDHLDRLNNDVKLTRAYKSNAVPTHNVEFSSDVTKTIADGSVYLNQSDVKKTLLPDNITANKTLNEIIESANSKGTTDVKVGQKRPGNMKQSDYLVEISQSAANHAPNIRNASNDRTLQLLVHEITEADRNPKDTEGRSNEIKMLHETETISNKSTKHELPSVRDDDDMKGTVQYTDNFDVTDKDPLQVISPPNEADMISRWASDSDKGGTLIEKTKQKELHWPLQMTGRDNSKISTKRAKWQEISVHKLINDGSQNDSLEVSTLNEGISTEVDSFTTIPTTPVTATTTSAAGLEIFQTETVEATPSLLQIGSAIHGAEQDNVSLEISRNLSNGNETESGVVLTTTDRVRFDDGLSTAMTPAAIEASMVLLTPVVPRTTTRTLETVDSGLDPIKHNVRVDMKAEKDTAEIERTITTTTVIPTPMTARTPSIFPTNEPSSTDVANLATPTTVGTSSQGVMMPTTEEQIQVMKFDPTTPQPETAITKPSFTTTAAADTEFELTFMDINAIHLLTTTATTSWEMVTQTLAMEELTELPTPSNTASILTTTATLLTETTKTTPTPNPFETVVHTTEMFRKLSPITTELIPTARNNVVADDASATFTPISVGEPDDVNVIIAITASAIGVTALVLIVAFIYLISKRQRQMFYAQRCRPVSLDAYSLDNVSVLGSVRRKGQSSSTRAAAIRASKRSYSNVAFDHPALKRNSLSPIELAKFVGLRSAIFEEFRGIPQIFAHANDVPAGCEDKNRYANVVPLPETRVLLQQQNNDLRTEYINANYVGDYKDGGNYYIACQAPLVSTIAAFWRMIWEQQSRVIIQATDLIENGIEKCAEYIPPSVTLDNQATYEDFHVILKNREIRDKYAISTLTLSYNITNASREITHYWYKWPETGVPGDAAPIIAMLIEARSSLKTYVLEQSNELKEHPADQNFRNSLIPRRESPDTANAASSKHRSVSVEENGRGLTVADEIATEILKSTAHQQGPLTVHCSPGTGRTGTIIACDMAIRSLEAPRRSVDIPYIVNYIRRCRASSIQTKEQYEFIYKVANMYATKITNFSNDI